MKRVYFLPLVLCGLALSLCAQQSGGTFPWPQVFSLPGTCLAGQHITLIPGTYGSNEYVCGLSNNWIPSGGGSSDSSVIITTGAGGPISGTNPCAAIQGCYYIETENSGLTITQWWEAPGSSAWVDMSTAHTLAHQTPFAALPPASLWPAGTEWLVTDCSTANGCSAGGGVPGTYASFVQDAGAWTIQPANSSGTAGAANCQAVIAGGSSITLNQICGNQNFIIQLAAGSNTVTAFSSNGYLQHTFSLYQPSAGSSTFIGPLSDHGIFTAGTDGLTRSLQSFTIQEDGITGIADSAGVIDQPTTFTSVAFTVGSSSIGTLAANLTSLEYDEGLLTQSWAPFNSGRTPALISMLGPTIIRFNNSTTFNGTGTYTTYSSSAPLFDAGTPTILGNATLNAFAASLCANYPSGTKIQFGVPWSSSQQTPAQSAAEVVYLYGLLGPSGTACTNRIAGIEIGNEPDGGGIYGTPGSSGSTSGFASQWNTVANAIKTAVPAVVFVAPSTGQGVWLNAYNTAFWAYNPGGSLLSNAALLTGGYLTQHYYNIGTVGAATIPLLLTPDSNLPGYASGLKAFSAANSNIPIIYNETNTVANGGAANVSNTLASAIWVVNYALLLPELANGAGTVTAIDLTGCGGNQNCFSQGYTPIQDQSSFVGPNPIFYGMYMVNQMIGSGNEVGMTITGSPSNMTAYGVVNGSETNTVICNKDPNQNLNVTITYPGVMSTASSVVLSASSLASTSGLNINGVIIENGGGLSGSIVPLALTITGGTVTQVSVPAHSVVLVQAHT